LPDAGRTGLGQDDAQGDIANEPALAAAGKHEGGDTHSQYDKDEGARNRVDMTKLKTLGPDLRSVATFGYFIDAQNASGFPHGRK